MSIYEKIEAKRQTVSGLVVSVILEIGLSYLFISLAIDSGSLLDYTLGILLFILVIRDSKQLFQDIRQHKNHGED